MSQAYQKAIANKIKNINQRYVDYEDKKDLVGGNFNELIDVKDGMGLKGKGLTSTSLPAGAGLTAAGGMRKYKKGKGKVEEVAVCSECGGAKGCGITGAGFTGAGIGEVLSGFLQNFNPLHHIMNAVKSKWDEGKKYGKRYGGAEAETVNILETPLKLKGYDNEGDEVMELEGSGLLDLMNPFKIAKAAFDIVRGKGMTGGMKFKLYGKKGGVGEFQELEGGGVDSVVKTFENKLGKGLTGGMCGVCEGEGKKKRATHFTGGKLNEKEMRNGNQALITGNGASGGAILGLYGEAPKLLKPKRKMKGKGLMDVLLKVANAPIDMVNDVLGHSSPLEDIGKMIGRDKVRGALGKAVGLDKALGIEEKEGGKKRKLKGKGMGKRPTKQDMPSSSFSGGKKTKKVNKRAEIVKKVMKEKGLGLIQASKYVKENNLY